MNYNSLRNFISGETDNLNEAFDNPETMELSAEDEQLIDETLREVMPILIADDIMLEAMESSEAIYNETMGTLESYLRSQDLLSESFSMSNPKKNYVRLNKFAIIERLRSILILKLARKNKDKNFKKYKIGTKIKRSSFKNMETRYGAKAGMMAKKIYAKKNGRNRIVTVIQDSKAKKK